MILGFSALREHLPLKDAQLEATAQFKRVRVTLETAQLAIFVLNKAFISRNVLLALIVRLLIYQL